jgi:phosphate/sulfate permease
MISVDVIISSFPAVLGFGLAMSPGDRGTSTWAHVISDIFFILFLTFLLAVIVGVVSLVLNIPLLRKHHRERARLKELSLSSLSKSLWKESRRSLWINRARGVLLVVLGIFVVGMVIFYSVAGFYFYFYYDEKYWKFIVVIIGGLVLFGLLAGLIFSARFLRNQRERMELTASAEELKKALQDMRKRAGETETLSVPSELLAQAARIESAQIAKERKDAVLQSVLVGPSGYGVTFDRAAAEQRRMLDISDRVELEDLVAQVSIEGQGKLTLQAEAVAPPKRIGRGVTKSKRVEIEYVIDQESRGIRIIAVRHGPHSVGSVKGGTHG